MADANVRGGKRRYSARSIAFDEQRRKEISTFGGRTIPTEEFMMVLEDYLSISIRRKSATYPMFKLQMALLLDVVDAEKAVAACKAKLEELKARSENDTPHAVDQVEADLQLHKTIRRALRDIGDGIAWRMFDYDRVALGVLATHPRSPHINMGGLDAELNAFAEICNETPPVFAILNDLTHFLKKADISVRRDSSNFEFVEVKSSRTKSSTLSRQRSDLVETLRFLSDGGGERSGETTSVLSLPLTPHSYFKAVAAVVRGAETTGYAWGAIGRHLTVEVIDRPVLLEQANIDENMFRPVRDVLAAWEAAGDLATCPPSTDRYLLVRNYAPFSIYPFTVAQRVKLMTGALYITARVNVSEVVRYVVSRGWRLVHPPEFHLEKAARSQADPQHTPVATFGKDGLVIELSSTLLGRIAFEFLSPKSIVDSFEGLRVATGKRSSALLVNFDGESMQWD